MVWKDVEGVLSKDMATVGEYLHTCKLKLSTTKTVLTAFHLNNKEAKFELKVKWNNETQPLCSELKYFAVKLDRSLTYCRHLKSLHKILTSREAKYIIDIKARFPCCVWLSAPFSFLLLRWKTADTVFVVLNFNFPGQEVFTYGVRLPCLFVSPLPLLVSFHQHAQLLGRWRMHTFWRRWLAGQKCRYWREGVPGWIPVGRHSWSVVTCSVRRCRW